MNGFFIMVMQGACLQKNMSILLFMHDLLHKQAYFNHCHDVFVSGLTAFDFILDYDEWIECGYFSDEIRARLKAYSLKHARDLIRAISKKVKVPHRPWPLAHHSAQNSVNRGQNQLLQNISQFSDGVTSLFMLPPIKGQHGALTY